MLSCLDAGWGRAQGHGEAAPASSEQASTAVDSPGPPGAKAKVHLQNPPFNHKAKPPPSQHPKVQTAHQGRGQQCGRRPFGWYRRPLRTPGRWGGRGGPRWPPPWRRNSASCVGSGRIEGKSVVGATGSCGGPRFRRATTLSKESSSLDLEPGPRGFISDADTAASSPRQAAVIRWWPAGVVWRVLRGAVSEMTMRSLSGALATHLTCLGPIPGNVDARANGGGGRREWGSCCPARC